MDPNLLLAINIRRIFEEAEEQVMREIKTELDTVGDVYSAESAQKWGAALKEANAASAAKDEKIANLTQAIEKHIQENQLLKIENEGLKKNIEQYMTSMKNMHAEYAQRLSTYDAMVVQLTQNNKTLMNICMSAGLLNADGLPVQQQQQPNYMMNQYSSLYYPPTQTQQDERMPSFIQAQGPPQQKPVYSPIQLNPQEAAQESFKTLRETFLRKMAEFQQMSGKA
jgi:regulator of replication initiation timing